MTQGTQAQSEPVLLRRESVADLLIPRLELQKGIRHQRVALHKIHIGILATLHAPLPEKVSYADLSALCI